MLRKYLHIVVQSVNAVARSGLLRHEPLDVTLLADAQDLALPVFANTYNIGPGVLAALPKRYVGNRFIIPPATG